MRGYRKLLVSIRCRGGFELGMIQACPEPGGASAGFRDGKTHCSGRIRGGELELSGVQRGKLGYKGGQCVKALATPKFWERAASRPSGTHR